MWSGADLWIDMPGAPETLKVFWMWITTSLFRAKLMRNFPLKDDEPLDEVVWLR